MALGGFSPISDHQLESFMQTESHGLVESLVTLLSKDTMPGMRTVHVSVKDSQHPTSTGIVVWAAPMTSRHYLQGSRRARGNPLTGSQADAQLCR